MGTVKYMIKETVNHFHQIEVDEELEPEIMQIVKAAELSAPSYDTGYESLGAILQKGKDNYGFEYKIEPNYCGTEVVAMDVVDEI